MRRMINVILAGFFIVFQGFAIANEIFFDVKKVRKSNKSAIVDISEIVNKYISFGAQKISVDSYLKKNKFALNYQPIAPDRSQTLVALYVEGSLLTSVGFYDEIRVIVVFENGIVKRADGKLIYRAL